MLFTLILTICTVPLIIRILIELIRVLKRKPFVWENDNKWAVITGATSGVGFEFARQLAHKGYNLLLISRNKNKLNESRKAIFDEFKNEIPSRTIQIKILAVDFTRGDIYEKIKIFLSNYLQNVFILVNNVGVMEPFPDYFLVDNYETINEHMINVNLIGGTKMLEMILPSLVKNKSGLVISVSSIGSVTPSPLMSIYSATKSYINNLTNNLAEEHHKDNIVFCTFYPNWISTKMIYNAGKNLFVPSAQEFVRSALGKIIYRESFQSTGYVPHEFAKLVADLTMFTISERLYARFIRWYFHKCQDKLKQLKEMSDDDTFDRPTLLKPSMITELF